MPIESISGLPAALPELTLPQGIGTARPQASFQDLLADAITQVDSYQHTSDDKLQVLASGEETDIHGTMIALQEAEISMRLLVSVRNKVLEAYNQVMNMSL